MRFDGAGDNADGVMLGMARYFAQPAHRPQRKALFIASRSSHTWHQRSARLAAANPDLASAAVLMLNVEHVAQRNFSRRARPQPTPSAWQSLILEKALTYAGRHRVFRRTLRTRCGRLRRQLHPQRGKPVVSPNYGWQAAQSP